MIRGMPLVYVIILTWNHKEDMLECVDSALQLDYPRFNVLVVDNGSTDGGPALLREKFPAVELILNEDNLGIARGYNVGIRRALECGADYVFILNNDTILDRYLLANMVQVGEEMPEAGILMPKIYYYGGQERIWSAGARRRLFPPGIVFLGLNALDGPRYASLREIAYAPSCGLLVRRRVFERVGGFDPGYFMYYDDWDFCERVRQANHKIIYVPQAKMWHKVSLSTQRGRQPARWWYVMGQSSVRFHLRHRGLVELGFNTLWVVLRELAKRNFKGALSYLAGIGRGLFSSQGRHIAEEQSLFVGETKDDS
ncbi:MAG: glycosyltransferase family 2 protein [Chloroflexi bacterium]|nr:glycosyltransferase family 2 protein [Chloroflexota bacterium]MCL5075621.1 glycosyltransferase family 2 protein [Chloroflexota bacterium]